MKKREILDYYNQQCKKDSNYSLDYKLVAYDPKLETITLKHKKCGNIFSKHKRLYRLSPRCDNKFCISEFRNNNNIKKYGVKNPSQVKEFNEKRKQTFIKKFGVDNPLKNKAIMDKLKKTNLEKYRFENPFQNKKVKEKIIKTNLEKYGVKAPTQSKELMNKAKKTNLESYGVENIFQNKNIKNKIKKTNLEKYGVENINKSKKILLKRSKTKLGQSYNNLLNLEDSLPLFAKSEYVGTRVNDKNAYYNFQCKKCGSKFEDYIHVGHVPRCYQCYPRLGGTSKPEREMQDWFCGVLNNS